MPKIRVESDVPERGVCVNGWQRCQYAHMKSMTCQIFNEKITAPEFIRLPQCIAAEVKESGAKREAMNQLGNPW